MSSRPGRPRKKQPLYAVRDWIEYTSDSDSDFNNVQENVPLEVDPESSKWPEASNLPPEHHQEQQYPPVQSPLAREDAWQQQQQQWQQQQHHWQQQQQQQQQQEQQQQQQQHQQTPPHDAQDQNTTDDDQHAPDSEGLNTDNEDIPNAEPFNNPDVNPNEADIDLDNWRDQPGPDVDYMSDPHSDDEDDYQTIFSKLKSDWLLIEINHKVSKTATDLFWKIGLIYFPKLRATANKKTCQFKTIRRKIYDDCIPEINMEIGYKKLTTGELQVVNEKYTPVKQYSPKEYEKLFEIASIKVSSVKSIFVNIIIIIFCKCERTFYSVKK